ncbi:DUF167 domain-containing protein [Chroogloeocystis siderophila]|jgi:uncharacterized protein (TIGR00251 family)|uniref:Uncharacterized protein n=1 Tax=Chroogloeocystis siderophila 5.2 s.c.1 TaxID=247279 RepID=A0A1U7HU16_9CHRO|nr:DUF167 domain-containing protein [Chroogloeocystis siderophila]OKH27093.1 hypothetical protein NIES1031_10270 [Chroogloeocystis siderophila 5.2 s.c.1]
MKIKPNSKFQSFIEEADGSLIIYVKSPPVEGEANIELVKILSEKFKIPRANIKINSGIVSRQKIVEIIAN